MALVKGSERQVQAKVPPVFWVRHKTSPQLQCRRVLIASMRKPSRRIGRNNFRILFEEYDTVWGRARRDLEAISPCDGKPPRNDTHAHQLASFRHLGE